MVQVGIGIYLKLHIERGIHGRVRCKVVLLHGVLGKVMPVVAWTQMLFGGITAYVWGKLRREGIMLTYLGE